MLELFKQTIYRILSAHKLEKITKGTYSEIEKGMCSKGNKGELSKRKGDCQASACAKEKRINYKKGNHIFVCLKIQLPLYKKVSQNIKCRFQRYYERERERESELTIYRFRTLPVESGILTLQLEKWSHNIQALTVKKFQVLWMHSLKPIRCTPTY